MLHPSLELQIWSDWGCSTKKVVACYLISFPTDVMFSCCPFFGVILPQISANHHPVKWSGGPKDIVLKLAAHQIIIATRFKIDALLQQSCWNGQTFIFVQSILRSCVSWSGTYRLLSIFWLDRIFCGWLGQRCLSITQLTIVKPNAVTPAVVSEGNLRYSGSNKCMKKF